MKKFNIIIYILIIFTVLIIAEPKIYANHLFVQNSGEIIRTFDNQQNYSRELEIINQEIDSNKYSIEKLQKKYEIITNKIQEMNKERQILMQKEEQLKAEYAKFNKKRRKRSSRTIRQEKILSENTQEQNEKAANFSNRQEALEKELKVYNGIMEHLSGMQSNQ